MAILKCKTCGGDLSFEKGVTVAECKYCGTKQTVPTIDNEKKATLLAHGSRLCFASEFDKASIVYESIVADFPEEAEAYWGLLLAEHQCRNNDELIALGICIDNEPNYRFAFQYADDVAKKEYQHIAQMTLCMEQVYILNLICNDDLYRASLRTENYYSSGLCDSKSIGVYESLDKKESSEMNVVKAKALESLLKSFTRDVYFIELNQKFHLFDVIEEEYSACLNRILEQILIYGEQEKNTSEQSLSFLTSIKELAAVWTKNAGERYLALAENFKTQDIYTDNKSAPEWTKFVFDCYDKAASLSVDQNKCLAAKRDFFELALKKAESIGRLDFLSKEYPNDWQVYWKYVQFIMNDNDPEEELTPKQMPYVFKVLNMTAETYINDFENSSKAIEDAIDRQEKRILYSDKLPEELRAKAGHNLKKALECAGDQAVELQKEWDTYIKRVNACCNEASQFFKKDLEQMKSMAHDLQARHLKYENKRNRMARGKGITCSILSLPFIFPAYAVFYVWQNLLTPERLLLYSSFWYVWFTAAVAALCLAGGVISVKIQRSLRKIASDERNDIKITKKLPLVAANLTGIVTAGSILLFIFNASNDLKTTDADTKGTSTAISTTTTLVTVNPVSVVNAEATSELIGNKHTYSAAYSCDGDVNTCWQDGVPGNGVSEVLTYYFDQPRCIVGVDIINGRVDIEEKYYDNNRIERLVVYYLLDGVVKGNAVVDLDDVYNMEPVYYELTDGVFNEAYYCDSIQVEIESVYEGEKYNDLCLTEIHFYEGIYE